MGHVPRSKLIGMHVYNPDGTYVGVVEDIALPVGEGEMAIQVMAKDKSIKLIEWSKISAVGDIVILKEKIEVKEPEVEAAAPSPAVQAPRIQQQTQQQSKLGGIKGIISKVIPKSGEKPLCPSCGKPLTFIEQYQRWYCYSCEKYV